MAGREAGAGRAGVSPLSGKRWEKLAGPLRGQRGEGLPAAGCTVLTFRGPARAELFQLVLVTLHMLLEKMHRAMVAALSNVLQVRVRVSQLPRSSQPTLQNFPVRDSLLLVAAATAAAALFALLVKRFGYKSCKFFHGCPVIVSTEIHLFSVGDLAALCTVFFCT